MSIEPVGRAPGVAALMLVVAGVSHCHGEEVKGESQVRATKLEYGFRRDPKAWVEKDGTLEAPWSAS